MNKKMLIPVCLALLSLSLAACGDDKASTDDFEQNSTPTHTHTWEDSWKSNETDHWHACKDASCTEVNGKVAHSGGTATCVSKAKCEVCNAEYGELASHTYSENWTCTSEGHYKACTVEGCDAHTELATHTGGTSTCKALGTCSECGEAYGTLAAHTWEEVVNADFLASKATCTAKATYYKSCAVCGDTSTETFEAGELLAHTGGTATCTTKAVCTLCNQPYGELASHKGGTATCQSKAVCEVCNQPYGELATTHVWADSYVKDGANGHYHPCSQQGCDAHSEVEAHVPGTPATESEPQTCTKCGYVLEAATGHIYANPEAAWSGNDEQHWHECQGCDEDKHITSLGNHVEGTPATCNSKAVCETCGLSYGATLAHVWDVTKATVETQPTPAATGKVLVPCSNTGCDVKHEVVLPVYNSDNYVTALVEESGKLSYKVTLTAAAIEEVVATDEVLDDAALTAALQAHKTTLAVENNNGYTITVNGEIYTEAYTVNKNSTGNKAEITIDLRKNQEIKFYVNGNLITFAKSDYKPVFDGTSYKIPTSGKYTFYLSNDGSIYGGCTTAVTYTSYEFKVNDVVYEADEVTTPVAGYAVTLAAEDVLKVSGTFAKGTDELYSHTCETAGNYVVSIAANGVVTVVEAEAEMQELTIYYYNNNDWENVYLYAWAAEPLVGWPGTKMTAVEGEEGWYSYKLEALTFEGMNILFNVGDDSKKSGDIALDVDKVYFFGTGTEGYTNKTELEEALSQPVETLYTISLNWNPFSDGAKVYAWIWGGSTSGEWVECTSAADNKLTFNTEHNITGCKIVRFNPQGFTAPDWNASKWNESGDIAISNNTGSGTL